MYNKNIYSVTINQEEKRYAFGGNYVVEGTWNVDYDLFILYAVMVALGNRSTIHEDSVLDHSGGTCYRCS